MFERLISQTPEIAHYVKSLDYTVREGDQAVTGLSAALGSLTRLKTLIIRPNYIKWETLPCKLAILKLMHLPTLSHLKLDWAEDFHFSDLALCVGLNSLEVVSHHAPLFGANVEIHQGHPPRLESYVGASSTGWLTQLCCARRADGKPVVDITGLKNVSHLVAQNLDEVKVFYQHCTQLTNVHLNGCGNLIKSTEFANLFLPSLQTLQHIHLQFTVENDCNPIAPLASEFASIADNNIIKSIKISMSVFSDVGWSHSGDWAALDQVFTQSKSCWKKLEVFTLHIEARFGVLRQFEGLVEVLQKLPETQLRGLVKSKYILFNFRCNSFESLLDVAYPAEECRP